MTSQVQVKFRIFDFSGLVTSASKISMLSANKANESAWIVSLTSVSIISCAFMTIIQVKVVSGHQVKKVKQIFFRDLELLIHAFRSDFRKEREK